MAEEKKTTNAVDELQEDELEAVSGGLGPDDVRPPSLGGLSVLSERTSVNTVADAAAGGGGGIGGAIGDAAVGKAVESVLEKIENVPTRRKGVDNAYRTRRAGMNGYGG